MPKNEVLSRDKICVKSVPTLKHIDKSLKNGFVARTHTDPDYYVTKQNYDE